MAGALVAYMTPLATRPRVMASKGLICSAQPPTPPYVAPTPTPPHHSPPPSRSEAATAAPGPAPWIRWPAVAPATSCSPSWDACAAPHVPIRRADGASGAQAAARQTGRRGLPRARPWWHAQPRGRRACTIRPAADAAGAQRAAAAQARRRHGVAARALVRRADRAGSADAVVAAAHHPGARA